MVLPNPSFIVETIVEGGRVRKARNTETRKSDTNALSLTFEVRIIIAIMLIPTKTETVNKFIAGTYQAIDFYHHEEH